MLAMMLSSNALWTSFPSHFCTIEPMRLRVVFCPLSMAIDFCFLRFFGLFVVFFTFLVVVVLLVNTMMGTPSSDHGLLI